MNIPSYPFYSLSLKLPNKQMNFSFFLLKLPNKRREEYFKIIFFILFHSLLPIEGMFLQLYSMVPIFYQKKIVWCLF